MNRTISLKTLAWFLTVLLATPPTILAQQAEQTVFKQEELDQILAPIALPILHAISGAMISRLRSSS